MSRSEIQDELGYSDGLTRRVCETLEQACLVETETDKTDGDISDVSTITSVGITYAHEDDLKQPTEAQNREETRRDIRDELVRL